MKRELKLKICGMRDSENIKDVAFLQPHFMGFIFYKRSPRFVDEDFVVPDIFPQSVKRVGVFVNEVVEAIIRLQAKHKLDFVQLHGSESIDQVYALKRAGCKIIKAFSVDDYFDFETINPYVPYSDYFLFDTKGKLHGGNAQRFNWQLLEKYNTDVPFFLSGGIAANHIEEILQIQHPQLHAIDVNSGVEISSGIKDPNKVNEIKQSLTSNLYQ